jgi:hypothetical protein
MSTEEAEEEKKRETTIPSLDDANHNMLNFACSFIHSFIHSLHKPDGQTNVLSRT